MKINFIFIIVSFLLLGCDGSSSKSTNEELKIVIEKKQRNWLSTDIKSYTYTYTNTPTDCPTADPYPSVEVTVEDGVITSLYVLELDTFIDLDNHNYLTIDGIFDDMLSTYSDMENTPSFDQAFSYPLNYMVNKSDKECDGYSVDITSFI